MTAADIRHLDKPPGKYSDRLRLWLSGRFDVLPLMKAWRHEPSERIFLGFDKFQGERLFGQWLLHILTSDAGAADLHNHGQGGDFREDHDFFRAYAAIGWCAIDTTHSGALLSRTDREARWQAIDTLTRECRWCAHRQHRRGYLYLAEDWSNDPDPDDRALPILRRAAQRGRVAIGRHLVPLSAEEN